MYDVVSSACFAIPSPSLRISLYTKQPVRPASTDKH